jgi:galactarate dehydratase
MSRLSVTATKVEPAAPHAIRMDEHDNVAIVANAVRTRRRLDLRQRLRCRLVLRERVPQAHKVALTDIGEGEPVVRYGIPIGYALKAIPAGSWVHERLLRMPAARSLEGLPMATAKRASPPPLEGFTFEGFRNADGSVGTRNILAITTTVQCVAGVVEFAVRASRPSCCRSIRTSTTWSAWSTPTAAAWRSTRPTRRSRSGPCATSRRTRTSAAR